MSSPPVASPPSRGKAAHSSAPPARVAHRAAHPFIAAGARMLNPFIGRLAGRPGVPLLAVLRHRGRRSGRDYATPVRARPTADGFLVPLTFGERADWFQNLCAAGGCVLRWRGTDYALVAPELLDWRTARPAFGFPERILLPLFGIDQFVRLRHVPAAEGAAQ